jgi:hypothetical protein
VVEVDEMLEVDVVVDVRGTARGCDRVAGFWAFADAAAMATTMRAAVMVAAPASIPR